MKDYEIKRLAIVKEHLEHLKQIHHILQIGRKCELSYTALGESGKIELSGLAKESLIIGLVDAMIDYKAEIKQLEEKQNNRNQE